jgi:hypothetical protein
MADVGIVCVSGRCSVFVWGSGFCSYIFGVYCVGTADRCLWPSWIWQDGIASGCPGAAAPVLRSSYKGWFLRLCQPGALDTQRNSKR